MPKPQRVVESVGSWWFFDDDAMLYCRTPKTEGPRASPPGEDWGGPNAGGLQDLVWHPFLEAEEHSGRLWIRTAETVVSAPLFR